MRATVHTTALLVLAQAALPGLAAAMVPARYKPDAVALSTPDTVERGFISFDTPPILHVKNGGTVLINTVSHGGLTADPVVFFAKEGIPAKAVLPDAVAIAKATEAGKWKTAGGGGGHVLTGPIYIDGAEPGDMLEVRILKVTPRTYYGVNGVGPGGVAPKVLTQRDQKTIKFDVKRGVQLFAPGIEPEMRPFMGIMAVAPPPEVGKVGSRAPGNFGGNMDFRRLTAGSTLYLPVFNKGALFVTGDSHAAQGDGEVSGNANESSMAPLLQFIVHKGEGKGMTWPWAEDAKNYYVLGMDPDLGKAADSAVTQTIHWLHDKKGLSLADAYHLCSVGVDFSLAQAVDQNLIIYGSISKAMFKDQTPYWTTGAMPAKARAKKKS
jgi:acetamidase/formamidase